MRYLDQSDQLQQPEAGVGVLLVNLGTPDEPTPSAVKTYLAEFLSDPRIVSLPKWLWQIILRGIVLQVRPKRSAQAYASIWTDEGSPLLVLSERLRDALQEQLGDQATVALAMRYGNPSLPEVLQTLRRRNIQRLLVLPLYPQYSATTTASIFDALTRELQNWRWIPELRFIQRYHQEPDYVAVLSESIRAYREAHGSAEKLLFSFHGIPKDYYEAGDPYPDQCRATAQKVAETLGLQPDQWHISFQSRFGKQEWVKPYTDATLKEWGREGIRSVQVVCPAFAVDCLETLEEIAEENREYFLESGGESYAYIPALNDSPAHARMLTDLVHRHLQGWPLTKQEN
ncbi:MAG: ferrochelatase [Candidatus Thiodiazotropha sp.]